MKQKLQTKRKLQQEENQIIIDCSESYGNGTGCETCLFLSENNDDNGELKFRPILNKSYVYPGTELIQPIFIFQVF